jgi:hypothetical protein
MSYTRKSDPERCDLMTIQDYLDNVKYGSIIDYDGFGHPVKDGLVDTSIDIYPSFGGTDIPKDATHIEWYNK